MPLLSRWLSRVSGTPVIPVLSPGNFRFRYYLCNGLSTRHHPLSYSRRYLVTYSRLVAARSAAKSVLDNECVKSNPNCRYASSETSDLVTIGDVSIKAGQPISREFVPTQYLTENLPQTLLRHLRWIMQKDVLGQDVFLIGPPGPLRRTVAMMYLELTNREVEYFSLSRDTTEADLKQRREIRSGTAFYLNQCAVRAAIEGRVLVLEGIEKAERNVLPVLNNLLENREMQLDDGSFLMAAQQYDKLLKEHGQAELDAWKLIRVSENFRVIALGLPVPRYQGNPLDPPLRSRFQGRDIYPLPFKEQVELLQQVGKSVSSGKLSNLLSFALAMQTEESLSLGLPDFPIDNLHHIVKIMDAMPHSSSSELLGRLYPHKVMLGKEGKDAVKDIMKRFELDSKDQHGEILAIDRTSVAGVVTAQLKQNGTKCQIQVPAGEQSLSPVSSSEHLVHTAYHKQLLAEMLQSHLVNDLCIIGPKGCGKSAVVNEFASNLGYRVEPIMLYQDMSARDLLQQRATLPNGDTTWRFSPLVNAALEGDLAVLDGVHRINAGSFAVLHRLVHDRELQLFDGSRLFRKDRYDQIKTKSNLTDEQLNQRGIYGIHPSFRIVALAEPPPVSGSSGQKWLTPELLTMFLYHHMRPMSQNEEQHVLQELVPGSPDLSKLLSFVHKLRESNDNTLQSLSSSLSTRQLLRIYRRLAAYPSEKLYEAVQKACMTQFLPRLARNALVQSLEESGIVKMTEEEKMLGETDKAFTCEVKDGRLRIGQTEVTVAQPENLMKVPDVLFYDNPQHIQVLEEMLKDFTLGEHLLLVGNQGVGKNKIVDRFLHLLNRPREYLQLHRDTTVQTLTLQPTVHDGVIVYEDSPLVRAVKLGHILVVDEADKAPTHVTCILKTLVEAGEMHLADGRQIVPASSGLKSSKNIIVMHPDFRMFVLANRPGFPFLGNDFFAAMGDIFSCHAIDNPDIESEMSMLRRYGPDVPEATLKKLVLAFGELRNMADQGLIAYPYSTREVVNMVKHLQTFPKEGLTNVVKNVFDFDSYNKEIQETVVQTLHKHGIPLGANPADVQLVTEYPLPQFEVRGQWTMPDQKEARRKSKLKCSVKTKKLSLKGPVRVPLEQRPLERIEDRANQFSELSAHWTIPMHATNIISDIAVHKAKNRYSYETNEAVTSDLIHIATVHPIGLYSMSPSAATLSYIDLYDLFPSGRHAYQPHVKITPMGAATSDTVALHEQTTNVLLTVNVEAGNISRIMSPFLPELQVERKRFQSTSPDQVYYQMCSSLAEQPEGLLLFYQPGGSTLEVLNMLEGKSSLVTLPVNIQAVHPMSPDVWLVQEADSQSKYLLNREAGEKFSLHAIQQHGDTAVPSVNGNSMDSMGVELLKQTLQLENDIPESNRILATPDSFATIGLGLPDMQSSVELYHTARPKPLADPSTGPSSASEALLGLIPKSSVSRYSPGIDAVIVPNSGQVIRGLPASKIPEEFLPKGVKGKDISGYLEVVDLANHRLRYIPVPSAKHTSPYTSWLLNIMNDVTMFIKSTSDDGLVTVDAGGCVRLWETSLVHLQRSLAEWRNMIGTEDGRALQISTVKEDSGEDVTGPKHGDIDPMNTPHVGGGNWAGGTGGRNTAGLGGTGGPYRLDAGHEVFQVAESEKERVPEEVRRAAREMARKAFKERLREIKMTEYDAATYEGFSQAVRRQVQSLRVILDSLQAKGKERQWLKNQTYGDLDEARLIEGLSGEKAIYRRRGEHDPELGAPQQKPKHLRLVVDVSGSMYRFNSYDKRLEREMEAILMAMEAFEGYESKLQYDIIGHSGEQHDAEFLSIGKPPSNNKHRMDIIKTMHAHSQFCLSGDNTLEATEHAIKTLTDVEADERFVIVLSDANLDRYGISPTRLGEILTSNENVNAYVIFIGSLGDQAARLVRSLPSGHAFVCMDTKDLPQILQQIFTSTMLS